jgi:hypothetical protein
MYTVIIGRSPFQQPASVVAERSEVQLRYLPHLLQGLLPMECSQMAAMLMVTFNEGAQITYEKSRRVGAFEASREATN